MTSIEDQISHLKKLQSKDDNILPDIIAFLEKFRKDNFVKEKNNIIFVFDQERDAEIIKKIFKII